MAADMSDKLMPGVSPRAFASVVQAILHGVGMQLAADPEAFDREEVLQLSLEMLRGCLRKARHPNNGRTKKKTKPAANNQ